MTLCDRCSLQALPLWWHLSSSRHSSWQWVHEVSQRHRACVFLPPTPIWHLAFPKCCCEPERGCLSLLQVSVFFYLHPARQHCPHASVVTYFPRNIKAWLRPYLCALKSKLGLSRLPQGCQSQPHWNHAAGEGKFRAGGQLESRTVSFLIAILAWGHGGLRWGPGSVFLASGPSTSRKMLGSWTRGSML